jgi:NAD(P)-dependent dehydrogenase (short-subunit alcohol dehydrogenase family)
LNGACRLEGKVAIVTGGAAGIGEAIVRLFTKHGAKVIIADVAEKAGRKLAESLSPALATYLHCDVSKEEDVSAAVDLAMDKYGQLDIMYNNAGTNDSFLVKSVAEYGNLQGHTLKAEDIAEAGLYLASDESKYVSGHNLVVDGGFTVVNHW